MRSDKGNIVTSKIKIQNAKNKYINQSHQRAKEEFTKQSFSISLKLLIAPGQHKGKIEIYSAKHSLFTGTPVVRIFCSVEGEFTIF